MLRLAHGLPVVLLLRTPKLGLELRTLVLVSALLRSSCLLPLFCAENPLLYCPVPAAEPRSVVAENSPLRLPYFA